MSEPVVHAPGLEPSLSSPPASRRLHAVGDEVWLADVLQRYRRDHGLSVREAGVLVGGSHWVWAQWEAGVVPGPAYLRRLAALLGLSPEQARAYAGPDRVRRAESVGDEGSHALARARLEAGLTAAEMARRMHVSASLVSRWEAGDRVPSRHYWPRLALVLGTDVPSVERLFAGHAAPSEVAALPGLREQRLRRGMTQAQLAAVVGVDVTSIQRWEHLRRAPARQARLLADALGTDLASLARPVLAPPAPKREQSPLRRLRRRRHLSSRIVAGRVRVSSSALLAWERGASQPSWAQARSLARALAVPVEEVFIAVGLEPPRHLDPARWTPQSLPAVLAELRRWQGWTQEELGALVGVGSGTVRAWEQGRQRPRATPLRRLDERLGASARLSDMLRRS
jgi:transcriptional regulator with XRE-family HTH domain